MSARAHFAALIAAHQPKDEREAAYLEQMRALALLPGDILSREHYAPGHVTASSFILSPERDALLLILHPKLNIWVQPGGHIEPTDADLLAAARRESAEEVGLTELQLVGEGLFDVDVHEIPARLGPPGKAAPAHAHYDVRFLFVAPHRLIRPEEGVEDARFVPFAKVEAFGTDDSVLRAVAAIQR